MTTDDQQPPGGHPPLAASGVPGLDEILRGGFRRDHIYLVEGSSGTGKTTLGLQFVLEGARRGEHGLYLTLAETPAELHEVAASHGWSLDGVSVVELIPRAEDVLEDGAYSLFPPSEVELHESLRQLQEILARERSERVVIDPLSAVRMLAADQAKYRNHMQALREILNERRCTVLLLDDSDAGAGFQPRSLAHGILSLQRLPQEYGPDRRRLRVTKYRAVPVADGYHDVRLVTGGMEVYPRLLGSAPPEHAPEAVVSTDLPGLDALLGGGLDAGASVLIAGAAGTGKSSLGMCFAQALLGRGGAVSYYLFDESPHSFGIRNRGIGLSLDAHLASGRLTVNAMEPADMSPGELSSRIRADVEEQGVGMVVIDSLSGYLHAMVESRFVDLHLHQLLSYLGQRGVITVLILTQHGIIGELSAPVDLSYISDTTILMRFFEARGRVHRALAVQKRRYGPHEKTIRELDISSRGIEIGEPIEAFQGVLSGHLQYVGAGGGLLDRKQE